MISPEENGAMTKSSTAAALGLPSTRADSEIA